MFMFGRRHWNVVTHSHMSTSSPTWPSPSCWVVRWPPRRSHVAPHQTAAWSQQPPSGPNPTATRPGPAARCYRVCPSAVCPLSSSSTSFASWWVRLLDRLAGFISRCSGDFEGCFAPAGAAGFVLLPQEGSVGLWTLGPGQWRCEVETVYASSSSSSSWLPGYPWPPWPRVWDNLGADNEWVNFFLLRRLLFLKASLASPWFNLPGGSTVYLHTVSPL